MRPQRFDFVFHLHYLSVEPLGVGRLNYLDYPKSVCQNTQPLFVSCLYLGKNAGRLEGICLILTGKDGPYLLSLISQK